MSNCSVSPRAHPRSRQYRPLGQLEDMYWEESYIRMRTRTETGHTGKALMRLVDRGTRTDRHGASRGQRTWRQRRCTLFLGPEQFG